MNDSNLDLLDIVELQFIEQCILKKASEIAKLRKNEKLQKLEIELSRSLEEFNRLTEHLTGLEHDRKKLEDKIAGNNEKIKTNEEKLFSGTITSSKELVNYQEEVKQLKTHNEELESKELEVMFLIDEAKPRLLKVTETKDKISSDIQAIKDEVSASTKDIEVGVNILKERRNDVLKKIPKDILSKYEDLRHRKSGVALAVLKNSFCLGCGLEMPSGQAEVMKSMDKIYKCPMCGRMLVLERDGIEELRAEIGEI